MKIYADSRRSAITASKRERDEIERRCSILNSMTGHEDGSVGSYQIEDANGKVRLVCIRNDAGDVNSLSVYVSTQQLMEMLATLTHVLWYEGFKL